MDLPAGSYWTTLLMHAHNVSVRNASPLFIALMNKIQIVNFFIYIKKSLIY
jgi:hypothetical protein